MVDGDVAAGTSGELKLAERLYQIGNEPDAQALHRIIMVFQGEEVMVSALVEDIAAGRTVRMAPVPVRFGLGFSHVLDREYRVAQPMVWELFQIWPYSPDDEETAPLRQRLLGSACSRCRQSLRQSMPSLMTKRSCADCYPYWGCAL